MWFYFTNIFNFVESSDIYYKIDIMKDIKKDEICNLYKIGCNYKEIGAKVSLDPRTVKKIIKINDFKKLSYKRKSIYDLNETYFNNVGDDQLWLIGLFTSDGTIVNDRLISLGQSGVHGFELIKYVKNIIGYKGPIYSADTIGETQYKISITSKVYVDKLLEYNVKQRKSLIYELPNLINEEQLKSFTRGYIDGDGSVGVYDNGSGYEYLVISFVGTKEFIEKIGDRISIKSSEIRKLKKGKNCWEIRWYGRKAIEFGNWIYSNDNLFLSKKTKIFKNYLETHTPDFIKYKIKKDEVKKLVSGGYSVKEISTITGIRFQTIYKWKKEF